MSDIESGEGRWVFVQRATRDALETPWTDAVTAGLGARMDAAVAIVAAYDDDGQGDPDGALGSLDHSLVLMLCPGDVIPQAPGGSVYAKSRVTMEFIVHSQGGTEAAARKLAIVLVEGMKDSG